MRVGCTYTEAVYVLPLAEVAVIEHSVLLVTSPTTVTKPVLSTVTNDGLAEVHVIVLFVAFSGLKVTVNCPVCPLPKSIHEGETEI